jgi:hypothetical protein
VIFHIEHYDVDEIIRKQKIRKKCNARNAFVALPIRSFARRGQPHHIPSWMLHKLLAMSISRRIRPRLSPAIQRRCRSYLAPPFLLDHYAPRYSQISSTDASKKRSEAYAHLRNCNLCPRLCGVNRFERTGVCLIGAETVKVSTIAPHFGEGWLAIRPRCMLITSRTVYTRTQRKRVGVLLRLQPPLRVLPES